MGGRDYAGTSPACWYQLCQGLSSTQPRGAGTACRTGEGSRLCRQNWWHFVPHQKTQ